jgi:hypothetical protein
VGGKRWGGGDIGSHLPGLRTEEIRSAKVLMQNRAMTLKGGAISELSKPKRNSDSDVLLIQLCESLPHKEGRRKDFLSWLARGLARGREKSS